MDKYVFVAIYRNREGEDVRVFRTEERAYKWADSIARESWHEWFPEDPMPTENVGESYFAKMNYYYECEYFDVERRMVIEDTHPVGQEDRS